MNEAEAIVNVIFVNNVDAVATIAGIRAVANVNWAQLVFGDYDAAALVQAPSVTDLQTTVIQISKVPGVERTSTQLAFTGW